MIIRICTEDVNPEATFDLVTQSFPCFTRIRGTGAWHGQKEMSIMYEIADLGEEEWSVTREKAGRLASEICKQNNQEAVLLQFIESNNILVYHQR